MNKLLTSHFRWLIPLLVCFALGVATLVAPSSVFATSHKVFVFAPGDTRARELQKSLASALPEYEFTAFRKPSDLQRALRRESPAAVVAPAPTLKDMGYSPVLKGSLGGASREPYVLITVDQKLSPRALAGESVGMFGIMGRSGMKRFCAGLLGENPKKVATVTKYADLLPLLQFRTAKGVILPKRNSAQLVKTSALKLVVSELPSSKVGLVSVASFGGDGGKKVVRDLKTLNRGSLSKLGIDGWK